MNGNDRGGGKDGRNFHHETPIKHKRSDTSQQSASTDSTVQTGAMTPMTPISQFTYSRPHNSNSIDFQARGSAIMTQSTLLGVTSMASFLAFLISYLPLAALIALAVFVASTAWLLYSMYLFGTLQYQRITEGRGFGQFISDSIYTQLTELTLHEWMADSSFTTEYRHLMLYFIPGLTPDQVETYIDRLPSRHRSTLRRPGLGHLFGESFMRFLMGNERYYSTQLELDAGRPSELFLPATAINRTSQSPYDQLTPHLVDPDHNDDHHSELGPPDETVSLMDRAITATTSPTTATATTTDNPLQEQAEEALVLADAFSTVTNYYVNQAVSSATSAAASFVNYVMPTTIVVTLGLLGGGGLLLAGRRPSVSSRTTAMGTMWFGGTAISMSLLYLVHRSVGRGWSRMIVPSRPPPATLKQESDDDSMQ